MNDKIGRIKILQQSIKVYLEAGLVRMALPLIQEKNALLTNGYQPPIPRNPLNQRQIRKRNRQKPK